MPVSRLDNARWGFASNCFVCEPSNQAGMRIEFFHDEDAGVVFAEMTMGERFSGAPRFVHGGVTLAVLDEAMAWGAIALAGSFALTRTTEARFLRPVAVDRPHRVEARLMERTGDRTADDELALAATVTDGRGRICVEASARFTVMSPAIALAAVGPLQAGDTGYLRAEPTS